MPGGQLAQLRTGAARSEHLPWASLREPLRAAPPRETRAFRVCVHVDGGSAFRAEPPEVQVEVAPNETVGQLKARLADMLCLQNAQLRLLWRCVGLPDRKALAACGPEHGSELELRICAGRAASASHAGIRPAALSGSLRLAASSTSRSSLPANFVHHGSTDREFKTFASFAAVVFYPGDVEQMAFYEFYSMGLPVFVPADPGRYMWPRLPGFTSVLDESCGPYAALAGTWELRYASGHQEVLAFDCSGRTELVDGGGTGAGRGSGKLRPLARMDELGFSHCVVLGRRGNQRVARRLRLAGEFLQAVRLEGEAPCEGSFAEAFGAKDMEQGAAAASVSGSRRPGGPEPAQPSLWDHDIFASTAWFLDARLAGASRAEHSPFNLGSLEAAREWAAVMDYFRFPAVGLFVSAAELVAALATGGHGSLWAANREMCAFNDAGLRHSLRQWRAVLSHAVP